MFLTFFIILNMFYNYKYSPSLKIRIKLTNKFIIILLLYVLSNYYANKF
ncbi:hypothetical protein HMPREF0219_3198 [Clostridioides difficile NAP07]|nr:hypothetical protein HMPREF0219_3198 [Clostridioides difficile NAP07]